MGQDQATNWLELVLARAEREVTEHPKIEGFARPLIDHLRNNAAVLSEWGVDGVNAALEACIRDGQIDTATHVIIDQMEAEAVNAEMLNNAETMNELCNKRAARIAFIGGIGRVLQTIGMRTIAGLMKEVKDALTDA